MLSLRQALVSIRSSQAQQDLEDALRQQRRSEKAHAKAWHTTLRFLLLLCIFSHSDAHLCEVGWDMMQSKHKQVWQNEHEVCRMYSRAILRATPTKLFCNVLSRRQTLLSELKHGCVTWTIM